MEDEVDHGHGGERQNPPLEEAAVLLDLRHQLILGNEGVQIVAEGPEDRVPDAGTDRRVEEKLPVVHAGETRRDRDQMADPGDEAAVDGRGHTVLVEVAFALLHLFRGEEAEPPQAASRKAVDEGAAEIVARCIVDRGPDIGPDRGEEDHKPEVEASSGGMIGGRRDDELRGDWDHGAL